MTIVELNPLGELCECVKTHAPAAFVPTHHHILPQSWGGPTVDENLVWLCPNSHTAVHRLIDDHIRYGGTVPWEIRQHFSSFQRDLAERAWAQRPENPTYTLPTH